MAVKRIVNLPTVSGYAGTAAGAFSAHTVTVDLPVGPRYHAIWLDQLSPGAAKVMTDLFGDLRLKVNGKTQRTASADELNKLNLLNGFTFAAKGVATAATEFHLPIWLAEPWRKNQNSQDGSAWATGDVASFQLEWDIKAYAAAAAGLVAPTFKAEIDNSLVSIGNNVVDQPLGFITKWLQYQLPVTALSTYHDFTGFPKREFMQSIHLIDLNVDEFEVKVDNAIIRQDTKVGNEARLLGREMLAIPSATATPYGVAADMPTRGMVDVVFDHDDRLDSALPMQFNGRSVRDFNFRYKTGAGGAAPRNIKTILQLVGPAE